jgi:hypothetical protein
MSNNEFPDYQDLKLTDYRPANGYYVLGMLRHLRPDIHFITPEQWSSYKNFFWLDRSIRNALANGKSVCVVPWDEAVLAHPTPELAAIMNRFADEPVWFATQLDARDQIIYTEQFKLRCKMFDLPWLLLNDALTYYEVCAKTVVQVGDQPSHNYLCMLGRYEPHKFALAQELRDRGLDKLGLITVSDPSKYPSNNVEFCVPNPRPPSDSVDPGSTPGARAAARRLLNNVWVSGNVKNYMHIETTYPDIPLIVHPDTTCGIFQNTEKALWPLLLGRMMLIHGRPGVMAAMQRFYDVDFAEYANMEFDSYEGDWSLDAHSQRLNLMLDHNQDLITQAPQIHQRLQPRLEAARWTIGKNLYEYFVKQINQIDRR